jgi:hypothetical protein
MPRKNTANAIRAVVAIIASLAWAWYFFGGGLENQVADDAIKQYQIAKRDGSASDACVHAGIVADAYLQAKDEADYQQWKATENSDCALAGVPGL